MALVEFYDVNKPTFGTGLEVFRFCKDTRQWLIDHSDLLNNPAVASRDVIKGEATMLVLAVIRRAARYQLLDGMPIGRVIPRYEHNKELLCVLHELARTESLVPQDRTSSRQATDSNRTVNVVIPLTHALSLVVNQAWGVGWQVNNHPILSHYPQLGRVQNPDVNTQEPSEHPGHWTT